MTVTNVTAGANRALFLDRDGVINVDRGYVHKVQDFVFLGGVLQLMRRAHAEGFKLVVITNQAGIGRGYYTKAEFNQLTAWMQLQCARAGGAIEKVYYSPYHPTAGIGQYKKDDFSRKPKPGMILAAQRELELNLRYSVLIGDKATDIQAGLAAGVRWNILMADRDPPGLHGDSYVRVESHNQALAYLESHVFDPPK